MKPALMAKDVGAGSPIYARIVKIAIAHAQNLQPASVCGVVFGRFRL